jgi:hypothetical protein
MLRTSTGACIYKRVRITMHTIEPAAVQRARTAENQAQHSARGINVINGGALSKEQSIRQFLFLSPLINLCTHCIVRKLFFATHSPAAPVLVPVCFSTLSYNSHKFYHLLRVRSDIPI